jgi:hypothetical protein
VTKYIITARNEIAVGATVALGAPVIVTVHAGAPGAPGADGNGGGANYLHTQASASAIWTVNHNLGARPTIEVRNNGGQVVLAEITHVSANQATITLVAAMSGTAFCTI